MKNVVFTVCNDRYKDFLKVLLLSLWKNIKGDIKVYVLTTDISEQTQANLKLLCKKKSTLSFIDLNKFKDDITIKILGLTPHYWRLLGPHVIKNEDLLLYLDVDIMLRKDISRLFNIDRKNKTISACVDYLKNIRTGINNWESFNFEPEKSYFNSGVLLIDSKKFIHKRIAEKILDITMKNLKFNFSCDKWEQHDQYGFNVVLYDDWLELPIEYNYGSEKEYSDSTIVHFIGNGKPWSKTCTKEFSKEYYDYLELL